MKSTAFVKTMGFFSDSELRKLADVLYRVHIAGISGDELTVKIVY